MHDVQTDPELTTHLVEEFGDRLPPTLIARTVETAAASTPVPDRVEAVARADVAGLADALLRSAAAHA